MMNQAIEMGDAATWGATLTASAALLLSLWQFWAQKMEQARRDEVDSQAAAVANRQAEAAERRALAVEQSLQQLLASLASARDPLEQDELETAERAASSAEAVSWRLARSKNTFVLRNEGNVTATGVRVGLGDHPAGLTRRVPEDAVVRPNESVEFLVIGAWGQPVPREFQIYRDGQEEPEILAVPST
ncbi:hypothetical protein LG634_31470 [Streptomyces bambusae]|uniref:hypothetical protein n=1 Tax=Streptomyces bambusae TaxID=1550616 RepID=UPI001CFFE896|nr:hypothetical protein [Streptomyces bambusae]MCB5169317.1 hypothetical protein [Streptomyces bambusae]